MANTELWDSVEVVLDATEELEQLIASLAPGADTTPLSTAVSDLARTISEAEADLRQFLADTDVLPGDCADWEEAIEALGGLGLRIERTRTRLDWRISQNRKRWTQQVLLSSLVSAAVTCAACLCVKVPDPALHLLSNVLVGLVIGIGFGVLFGIFFKRWDKPVR